MSNENETKEQFKSSKKYVALAFVALLAVIGIVMSNSSEKETKVISPKPEVTANVTEGKAVEEPTIARIDLTTPLVNADEPQFEVYINGSKNPIKQAKWMSKFNRQGYVIQKKGNSADIVIKAVKDTDIRISLKGQRNRNSNNKTEENWVEYTSLLINGKESLPKQKVISYSKPFNHSIQAKVGDTISIIAKWNKHKKGE